VRITADDARFLNSSRAIVRFGCDNPVGGFNIIRNEKKMEQMLALFDPTDQGKKERSELLLNGYLFQIASKARSGHYANKKGSLDKPVNLFDLEFLKKLPEVESLSISPEEFLEEAKATCKIFREVINGDAVRALSSAIEEIMPELLKRQQDDKVRSMIFSPPARPFVRSFVHPASPPNLPSTSTSL
jgi:hypothetical protein